MVTTQELKDTRSMLWRDIEAELKSLQSGISAFTPAAAGKGDAEGQISQAKGVLPTIQAEIDEGKRFMEETVIPVKESARVSLNPELLKSVRMMFNYLHDLNNTTFQEDAGTLRVVFKAGQQTREKQLFSDIWKLHGTMRTNLPKDVQSFLERAPPDLRAAIANLQYKSTIGTVNLKDGLGWFQTQGDFVEKWVSALNAALARPPALVSKRFVEVVADPGKDAELKAFLARKDLDFKVMLDCAKNLRSVLRIYEKNYYQLNGVLELVFRLVGAYYTNPAEFKTLSGK